ncbi:MAG: 2-hydroxyacyl-CoA dehydratase family protein [Ignavibacteriaceae bacterium]|jgi:benzoyl-CoA reductase/2-hydroxyglutaryl-CoA dehydratase subunit BcrC/BadD/HgdB|nr:2-hydroxyacyl-CoA dehydratase family protein [Ignavibacteriaceae bacterium]MCW8813493.1 2-hydroxyacyl-CoA dehydratase family protein [Chlorobium sp.]MCW8817871.1 2-hydroxyacyl-CoA dehydratase family protein [Ignavibacteriaceae bacterium]MCW8822550.1 2-hydroxyacyl-CoA dehydratase family protein [Ignavibacteriaceae bacterium]MCW8994531.1 2-hydroxyacyl-CoA dehydratase family protein [Psychromonas sp.]
MVEEKKVVRKKIEATGIMNKYMADYFYELDRASKSRDKKIAWCTSVGPAELLLSMGFLVYYPENHGALLGTSRMSTDVIPNANVIGYSPDICSYLTADIGAYLKGVTPLSKAFEGIESVPKPDVLVYNTNQCRDVKDWFGWYSRELNVPLLGVHTHRNPTDIGENVVSSISQQIKDLVEPLEKISGNKFDLEKLKKVVALSRECSELWKEVLETASTNPSPLTFFDGTIHMGPAVVLRGTQQAVDYYKILLKELKERVKNKEGAVEDEKFRIYWEGMPVWGRLRAHSELFANLKACVLASTYCNSWIFTDFDPEDPFTSMAKAYSELFIVKSDEAKEKYMKRMIDLFKIDGVIYHDAKTCPNNSNNRYGMPQRLEKETGIPSLVINGDLNDLRLISDEQTKTNVEAFIEQLDENKR